MNNIDKEGFDYRSYNMLKHYVNCYVEFITLYDTIRKEKIYKDKGKYYLPESGGVDATTVPIKLPPTNKSISEQDLLGGD